MADFTLFEVHLHDGFEFSPTNRGSLFRKSDRGEDELEDEEMEVDIEYEEDVEEMEADDESSGRGPGLLIGLVLLVGIAAIVRYLRSGTKDEEYEALVGLDTEEVEVES